MLSEKAEEEPKLSGLKEMTATHQKRRAEDNASSMDAYGFDELQPVPAKFFWMSHNIRIEGVDQIKGTVHLFGHFKFFWRVSTKYFRDCISERRFIFHTIEGDTLEYDSISMDGKMNTNVILQDNTGTLYPFNKDSLFKHCTQEMRSTWFSVQHGGEHGTSLLILQVDALLQKRDKFEVHLYPFDQHVLPFQLNIKWFPTDWLPSNSKRCRWELFDEPPCIINSAEKDANGKRKKLRDALPGFGICDGMPSFTATQYVVQDLRKDEIFGELKQKPSIVHKSKKKEVFLCVLLQRSPFFFGMNVVLPVFLIVLLSMSTFTIDDAELYDIAAITLTTLLTLVGMKYITLTLIPQKSYATIADIYLIGSITMNCVVFLENVLTTTDRIKDSRRAMHYIIFGAWILLHVAFLVAALALARRSNMRELRRSVRGDDEARPGKMKDHLFKTVSISDLAVSE
eukprot:m.107203 g.107203  ORF g.107203 m.107203 type:complete len:455 (+) comp13918_c0_seq1:94-1458(+)